MKFTHDLGTTTYLKCIIGYKNILQCIVIWPLNATGWREVAIIYIFTDEETQNYGVTMNTS